MLRLHSTPGPMHFVRLQTLVVLSALLITTLLANPIQAQTREDNAPLPTKPVAPYTQQRSEWYYSNATIPRLNPLGLSNRTRLGLRLNLFPETNSVLLKDTHISLGVAPEITPAFVNAGPFIQIKPLAILELQARYSWLGYFATFDHLQFFPSANSSFTPDVIREGGDEGRNRATLQRQLTLAGRLQGKVGPIALRSQLTAIHNSADPKNDNERVVYEPTFDTLVSVNGWIVFVDTDLLYVTDSGLSAGIRHNWLTPVFEDSDFAPGESTDVDLNQHRIGPLVAWTFDQNPGAAISKQTVFAIINVWLKHPNRAGTEVSRAVPYLAFGYAFQGLLL